MILERSKAEREGFEPPVAQAPQQISSLPHSTTLPSLRENDETIKYSRMSILQEIA